MKRIAVILTLLVMNWPAPLVAQTTNLLTNGDFENQPNWDLGIDGDGSYAEMVGDQIPGWTIESEHAATIHLTPSQWDTR